MKTLILATALCLASWCAGLAQQPTSPPPATPPSPPKGPTKEEVLRAKLHDGFPKLRTGMTKEEVAAIVGYPETNKETDVWEWRFKSASQANVEEYQVEFKDGRLAEKNRAGLHGSHSGED